MQISLIQVSMENMTFDDLILESAESITKATSSLIQAATAAQRELVAQGKIEETSLKVWLMNVVLLLVPRTAETANGRRASSPPPGGWRPTLRHSLRLPMYSSR